MDFSPESLGKWLEMNTMCLAKESMSFVQIVRQGMRPTAIAQKPFAGGPAKPMGPSV